jgi:hypothetical protein
MTDAVATLRVSSSTIAPVGKETQPSSCKRGARPLLDVDHPQFIAYHEELYCGFVYWPAYTVSEARLILGQSDDSVRKDFSSGRYGAVRFSPTERRHIALPGDRPRREWRQMWIPFPTLITYIRRTANAITNHVPPRVRERRLRTRARFAAAGNKCPSDRE